MKFRRALLALVLGSLAGAGAGAHEADPAVRLVIVANSQQPESVELARFYAGKRGVPTDNIVALPLPMAETITWREFIDQVYQPLQDELYRRGWLEGTESTLVDRYGRRRYAFSGHRISYLVTCRGVPLRVQNEPAFVISNRAMHAGFNKSESAVDAEFALLAFGEYEITGPLPNPLFARDLVMPLDAAQIVKVSRLDGPDWESARRLVTSALAAEERGLIGRYYVDLKGPHAQGDQWLEQAATQLRQLDFDGVVETTPGTLSEAARFDVPVLYFGWYAENVNGPFRTPGFTFPTGAIAQHIHSFSAQTLHSEGTGWCGPLVARGVAATVGNVFEPDLKFVHRPPLLLRALARGWNWGDAVFHALPALSWQQVALGDPLYRPFKVSLAEQLRRAGDLDPEVAAYLWLREANRLVRENRRLEAVAVLRRALEKQPSDLLRLGLVRLLLEGKDVAAAAKVVDEMTGFEGQAWHLGREAAQLMMGRGATRPGLRLYLELSQERAPSTELRLTLLGEARQAAESAGDRMLAAEFERQLAEARAPVPALP